MTTRDIVLISLFAAIMAVLGVFPPIAIPIIPVPITAQSLGVMLAGGILGAKRGFLSITLFLSLVALGLPLLSGGRGGLIFFVEKTGGFLFGFAIAAFVIGWFVEANWKRLNFLNTLLFCIIGGIFVLNIFGALWLSIAFDIPIGNVAIGMLPFIPGDIIKAFIATATITAVAKSYPIINTNK